MRWLSHFGTQTDGAWYGYTGTGDTPDYARNGAWQITEKYLSLPGGVELTLRPQQTGTASKVFSLPNIHGDTMATTDATGIQTGTFTYDPFGGIIGTGAILPDNTGANASFGWVGQHEKFSEAAMKLAPVQMGARVYIPTIGRFLSVDPEEGGNENNYVYPPDPVNDFDLDGNASWFSKAASVVTKVATVGSFIPGPIGMVASGVLVASAVAKGNYAGALQAASGLIPGGKAIGSVAKLASKAGVAKKVMPGAFRKATGFTTHGWNRAWGSRGDGGITTKAIHDIVKKGARSFSWKNRTWQYKTRGGFVSLNWRGKVVSAGIKKNVFGRQLKRYR